VTDTSKLVKPIVDRDTYSGVQSSTGCLRNDVINSDCFTVSTQHTDKKDPSHRKLVASRYFNAMMHGTAQPERGRGRKNKDLISFHFHRPHSTLILILSSHHSQFTRLVDDKETSSTTTTTNHLNKKKITSCHPLY
jgi:hypothetical protein